MLHPSMSILARLDGRKCLPPREKRARALHLLSCYVVKPKTSIGSHGLRVCFKMSLYALALLPPHLPEAVLLEGTCCVL